MASLRNQLGKLRRTNFARQIPEGQEVWLAGYSDASYSHQGGRHSGGWGLWVRDDHHRILRMGPCPDWIQNVQHAELCGVVAALHTAMSHLNRTAANIMVVKTDNQGVAKWFGWRGRRGEQYVFPDDDRVVDLLLQVYEQAAMHEIRMIVTWRKGHQKNDSTEGYLNHRVDRLAHEGRTKRTSRMMTYDLRKPRQDGKSEYVTVNRPIAIF